MDVKVLSAKYLNNNKNQVAVSVVCDEVNGTEPFTYFVSLDNNDDAPLCQYLRSEIELGNLTIQDPDRLPDFVIASEIRSERDSLLSNTDKFMTIDYPISDEDRNALRVYRQALRDIPQQEGFPENVVWPDKPSFIK